MMWYVRTRPRKPQQVTTTLRRALAELRHAAAEYSRRAGRAFPRAAAAVGGDVGLRSLAREGDPPEV